MSLHEFCELFRRLIYDRSERRVSKQQHFMNGHEQTCLACVEWLLKEADDILAQHLNGEHLLDAADLSMVKRNKAKLLTRAKQLKKRRQAIDSSSDIGVVEPTNADLLRIANEEDGDPVVTPDPVQNEDGDSQACIA